MSTYTQILYQIVFGSKDYTMFIDHRNQGLLFGYITVTTGGTVANGGTALRDGVTYALSLPIP
jgi:hypothetical protein